MGAMADWSYKKLSTQPAYQYSDGQVLLINAIMQKEGLDHRQALKFIKENLSEVWESL